MLALFAALGGAGLKRPAPSAIFGYAGDTGRGFGRVRYLLLYALCLALCLAGSAPARVLSAPIDPSIDTDTSAVASAAVQTPWIGDVIVEFAPEGRYALMSDLRPFGNFVIYNPDLVPFTLRVKFDNGGRLRNQNMPASRTGSLKLRDLALHCKITGSARAPLVKELTAPAASVYEAHFLAEDDEVHGQYSVELWGGLNPGGDGVLRDGQYVDVAHFEILPVSTGP